jgi:hypothetical protein
MVRAFGAYVRSMVQGLKISAISRGPEARSIPAWRNAPGAGMKMFLRAEGPIHGTASGTSGDGYNPANLYRPLSSANSRVAKDSKLPSPR